MVQEPSAEWDRISTRLDHSSDFITRSGELSPRTAEYQSSLYRGWILLIYAEAEGGANALGSAYLRRIGKCVPSVPLSQAPTALAKGHLRDVLKFCMSRLDRIGAVETISTLSGALGSAWAENATVGSVGRNLWPDNVVSWLRTLAVSEDFVPKFGEIRGESGWSLERRMRVLVEDRNRYAHGSIPDVLADADATVEVLEDVRTFLRECLRALQCSFAQHFSSSLTDVGSVDTSTELGDGLVPIRRLDVPVEVDGDVVMIGPDGKVKIRKVRSIQSESVSLDVAMAGAERVSLGLPNHGGVARLCLAP